MNYIVTLSGFIQQGIARNAFAPVILVALLVVAAIFSLWLLFYRKRALDDLEQQLGLNKKILESLHEGYLLVDEELRIIDVNTAYCKMVGFSRTELLSKSLSDLIPADFKNDHRKFIAIVRKKGSVKFETRHITKNGKTLDLEASAAALEIEGKAHLVGLVRNVTDRKKAKRMLEESEQRFKSLFENNPHPVFYLDLEGSFQGANPKFTELSGYSVEELQEKTFAPFVDQKDLDRTWDHFKEAASGKLQQYEITGIQRNGEKRDVQITNFPIVVADEIAGIFGVVQDVTEQKRHSRELKESEQKWQHLVEDNPQPVQVTVDGKIVFINEAGAILYGAQHPEGLMGRSVFDFSHPDLVKRIEERKHHLENGLPVDRIHEHKIIRLDGKERFVEVHSIPIQYQGKKAIQTVLHDVTDRKEKEQIIKQSLAEKEVLLQEIHHRVKNNLAVISGLVELQAMSSNNLEVKEVLKECQLRIQSMAMIHEKLYQTETFTNIEFRNYIQELVNSISVTFDFSEKNIAVTYRMESVRLNINQAIPCALILNELIVNCYKHAFSDEQEGNVKITLQREGKVLELTVADDGVGLPRGFTMKNQQSLGMTLVQTLTEQLQGELTLGTGLQSRGSSFSIRFEKT